MRARRCSSMKTCTTHLQPLCRTIGLPLSACFCVLFGCQLHRGNRAASRCPSYSSFVKRCVSGPIPSFLGSSAEACLGPHHVQHHPQCLLQRRALHEGLASEWPKPRNSRTKPSTSQSADAPRPGKWHSTSSRASANSSSRICFPTMLCQGCFQWEASELSGFDCWGFWGTLRLPQTRLKPCQSSSTECRTKRLRLEGLPAIIVSGCSGMLLTSKGFPTFSFVVVQGL